MSYLSTYLMGCSNHVIGEKVLEGGKDAHGEVKVNKGKSDREK